MKNEYTNGVNENVDFLYHYGGHCRYFSLVMKTCNYKSNTCATPLTNLFIYEEFVCIIIIYILFSFYKDDKYLCVHLKSWDVAAIIKNKFEFVFHKLYLSALE